MRVGCAESMTASSQVASSGKVEDSGQRHSSPRRPPFMLSLAAAVSSFLLLLLWHGLVVGAHPRQQALSILSPQPNTVNAPANSFVSLTYSDSLDYFAVSTETFTIHGMQTGLTPGSYEVIWEQMVFDPSLPFLPGELVYATATTGTIFMNGSSPATPTVWQFQVAPGGGSATFDNSGQQLPFVNGRDGAIGDLDGDRDLDAVTVDFTNSARVWLNVGGELSATNSFSPGPVIAIALGDVDNDGDLDLFSATSVADEVWFNDGGGHFTDSGQRLGRTTGNDVSLGDVDGDGDLDAFVANDGRSGAFSQVWLNDGTGFFVSHGPALGDLQRLTGRSVALGDLDGDRDLDAVVGMEVANGGPSTQVWRNDGHGIFSEGQGFGSAEDSRGVSLGDLDGDGDLDLFVANFMAEANRVWLNQGKGDFLDSGQVLGSDSSWQAVLGDVDADGDLDALVANSGGHILWLNDGHGIFPSPLPFPNRNGFTAALGDMDNDGDLDAFIQHYPSFFEIWTNLGGMSSELEPSVYFGDSGQTLPGDDAVDVDLGDLDGDGDLDAYLARSFHNERWEGQSITAEIQSDQVAFNVGVNSGQFTVLASTGDEVSIASAMADLDKDNDLDLFVSTLFTDYVRLNPGNGMLIDSQVFTKDTVLLDHPTGRIKLTRHALDVALADLDGDGDVDAFLASAYTFMGDPFMTFRPDPAFNLFQPAPEQILLNDGSGQLVHSGQILGEATSSLSVALADLDGDLDLDAVVGSIENVTVWLNAGGSQGGVSGRFQESQTILYTNARDVALGDVNGDGSPDAILAGGSATEVWLATGDGHFTFSGQRLGDGSSNAVALGDLDGDSDLDAFIAYGRASGQPNQIWLNGEQMLPLGIFSDNLQRLGDSRSVAVSLGDVDGDGDLDAMVANQDSASRLWINEGILCCPLELLVAGEAACMNLHQLGSTSLSTALTSAGIGLDLNVFARMRDELLWELPLGPHFIELYYTHTPELVSLLLTHPSLWDDGLASLLAWQPKLEALLDGEGDTTFISAADITAVEDFLAALLDEASTTLAEVISTELDTLGPLDSYVGQSMSAAEDAILNAEVFLPVVVR